MMKAEGKSNVAKPRRTTTTTITERNQLGELDCLIQLEVISTSSGYLLLLFQNPGFFV